MIIKDGIYPYQRADLTLQPGEWPFATDNKAAIQREWEETKERLPDVFDGTVFVFDQPEIDNGTIIARATRTRYSAYLLWRRQGLGLPWAHLFASCALISSDGALILGLMSPRTVTGGTIGTFAGNFDNVDVIDGQINAEHAARRECLEETGIRVESCATLEHKFLIKSENLYAITVVYRAHLPASEIEEQISRAQHDLDFPEIAQTYAIRSMTDLENAPREQFQGHAYLLAQHILESQQASV